MADVDMALKKADLFQTLQAVNRDGLFDQDVLEINGDIDEETIHKFVLLVVDKLFPAAELFRNEEGTIYNIREDNYKFYKDKINTIKGGKDVKCSSDQNGFIVRYIKDANAYQIYRFLQKVAAVASEEVEKQKNAPKKKQAVKKKIKDYAAMTTQEKLNDIVARRQKMEVSNVSD